MIQISLTFVAKGLVDNEAVLAQVMAKLAPNRRQAITWTNADPVHRRIYAAPGEDELNHLELVRSLLKQMYCYKV